MKKLMLIFVLAITTSVMAVAQPIKFGVKGGLNFASSSVSVPTSLASVEDTFKANQGYHIGLTTRVSLLGLYVQGDALYVRNSFSVGEGDAILETIENRLEIPVVAGIKLLFLRVYAGPRFIVDLGNKIKNIDDAESAWNNRALGYQAGVGLDLGRIGIDANFNSGFAKDYQDITDAVTGVVSTFEKSNANFRLSLSYYF